MKKCTKKFLWFTWQNHDWEEYDIFEKVKIIGTIPDVWKAGIWKEIIRTYEKQKCSKCKTKRTVEVKAKEVTHRRHYS